VLLEEPRDSLVSQAGGDKGLAMAAAHLCANDGIGIVMAKNSIRDGWKGSH
jgi:hypothetical protein